MVTRPPRARRARLALGLPWLPLLLAGCELGSVTVVSPTPGVVVHAVLNPDAAEQVILLEETQVGRIDINDGIRYTPLEPVRTAGGIPLHDADVPSPTSVSTAELVTVLSTETDGSERDRATIKTEEEMADDTARLFRRSELSLREKAERDARRAQEDKRRAQEEVRARKAEERRLEQEERARAAEEGRKYKRSSTLGSSSSSSKGRRLSTKKLFRSLSSMSNKILTELNELNGNPSSSGEFRANIVCTNPKLKKRSSSQAATIEKARDLIDNVETVEEEGDVSVSVVGFLRCLVSRFFARNHFLTRSITSRRWKTRNPSTSPSTYSANTTFSTTLSTTAPNASPDPKTYPT